MAKSHLNLATPTEVNQTLASARARRRTSDPGAPDAERGRTAGRGGQGQPPWAPGRDHDPGRLPPWPQGGGGLRPPLEPGRVRRCDPACAAGQERHAQHPPPARRRDACTAPAAAGERYVAVRLRQRAGSPFTTAGFARMVERAAAAGLKLKAHPHMLREACGYALADRGYDTRAIQVWLGHRFRRWRCANRYQPSPGSPGSRMKFTAIRRASDERLGPAGAFPIPSSREWPDDINERIQPITLRNVRSDGGAVPRAVSRSHRRIFKPAQRGEPPFMGKIERIKLWKIESGLRDRCEIATLRRSNVAVKQALKS